MLLRKTIPSKIWVVFSAIITKILYDVLILKCLPRIYFYGISYGVDFNANKQIEGWILFFILLTVSAILLNKQKNSIGNGLFILLYLYYVPISSAYYLNNTSIGFLVFSSIFWIGLVVANSIRIRIGNSNTTEYLAVNQIEIGQVFSNRLFYIGCAVIAIGCIIYGYQYNGLKLTLDIRNIYDARANYVGTSNTIQSILFNFGGFVIVPIGLMYGLRNKKIGLSLLCLIAQLAIFSIARQKSQLLIILIVLALHMLLEMHMLANIRTIVSLLFPILIIICFIEYIAFRSTTFFTLFIRRMMYFPAWLNTIYYDYFSTHPLLLFRQDVFLINRMHVGRYSQSVLNLINYGYFRGYVASPNTGLFAEAFMHFGYFGAFFYPFFIIGMTRLLFKYVDYYDEEISTFFCIRYFMALTNIPLSGGIFVITFFLFIPFTLAIIKFQLRNSR